MGNLFQVPRKVNFRPQFPEAKDYPLPEFISDLENQISSIEARLNGSGIYTGGIAVEVFRLRAIVQLFKIRNS
jgi:hypothetical protein